MTELPAVFRTSPAPGCSGACRSCPSPGGCPARLGRWLRPLNVVVRAPQHHCHQRRVQVQPDDVAHLVHEQGAAVSLKVCCRCGSGPNGCQMRRIAFWVMPISRAISRGLPCVAPAGLDCSVSVATASMRASSIVRGALQRGASSRPSSRSRTTRPRHCRTSLCTQGARSDARCRK